MLRNDLILKVLLFLIALFLGMQTVRYGAAPIQTVQAQAAQFDHINVISALFLHQGEQGLLLLDKRNGNVWFMPRKDASYGDPRLLLRVPFEKLDK